VTDLSMALTELLRKYKTEKDEDVLRDGVRLLAHQLMELEVNEKAGAEKYERSPERTAYRNGYRERDWDTRVGTIPLRIPRLRTGTYFPSLIEPRRRAERAVVSVIQEAYVHGVSTRKVDDLVRALGMDGISRSEVSRLCSELDAGMKQFRDRQLEGEYPYVWLDGKCVKVRYGGRVENQVAIVAVGVNQSGQREILGFDVGPAESHDFWLAFLRSLAKRGLRGTRLVISDAHEGLKQAIAEVLTGASWQRCRVHFMRNLLALVPKKAQTVTAAWVRTIFAQPDQASARDQLDKVARALESKLPRVSQLLRDAEADVLAHMTFPVSHWRQLHSTNTLERVNREIERRTGVVGIFPNAQAALRLIGAVLEEQHEEWTEVRRYFSIESMALLYGKAEGLDASLALVAGEEVFVI
jgi:putative transposase